MRGKVTWGSVEVKGQRLRSALGICFQDPELALSYAHELPTILFKFSHPQPMKISMYPHFTFSCLLKPSWASGIFVLLLMVHTYIRQAVSVKHPFIATHRSSKQGQGELQLNLCGHAFHEPPSEDSGELLWVHHRLLGSRSYEETNTQFLLEVLLNYLPQSYWDGLLSLSRFMMEGPGKLKGATEWAEQRLLDSWSPHFYLVWAWTNAFNQVWFCFICKCEYREE